MQAAWANPALRELQSQITAERWADPAFREKMAEIHGADEFRARMSELSRKHWDDPELRKKTLAARKKKSQEG